MVEPGKFEHLSDNNLSLMSRFYAFAAIVLFWVTLSTSLMRLLLAASPEAYKVRAMPAYRSVLLRSSAIAQVSVASAGMSYN